MPKTVFVLGAGASAPYGFPTGARLRTEICKKFAEEYSDLLKKQPELSHRPALPQEIGKAQDFANNFNWSSTPSIDLFLSRRKKYEEIGKLAIVQRLTEAEKVSVFNEDMQDYKQDWYSYLFHQMTKDLINIESIHKFAAHDYSFVTFNYDRSLEYFLWRSFQSSFSEIGESIIDKKLREFTFMHIYGQIAYLPWQQKGSKYDYLSKGEIIDIDTLKTLSKNIRVMHDNDRCNDANIGKIQQEIYSADIIIFLGFSFANENLEVLGIPNVVKQYQRTRKIYASMFGETHLRINKVNALLWNCIHTKAPQNEVKLGDSDQDCLKLLQEIDL